MNPSLNQKNNDSQQQIELFFSGQNIPSEFDIWVMFCKTNGQGYGLQGYEKSDRIDEFVERKNLDYRISIIYTYIYEKTQDLTIQQKDFSKMNFHVMDEIKTTINEIMSSPNHVLEKSFTKQGTFIIKADVRKQVNEKNPMLYWKWWGEKIKNMDGWFGTSDPFLRFFKLHESQNWLMVHETEFLKDNESPIWKGFGIPADRLFNDSNIPFKVELWAYEKSFHHKYIGSFTATFNEIVSLGKVNFEAKTKNDKLGGIIGIGTFIWPPIQIKLTLGMDFQQNEVGLHQQFLPITSYSRFLVELLDLFIQNGAQEKISFYGFGGVPQYPTFQPDIVDNCFAVNGTQDPLVERDNIQKTYQEGVKHIILGNHGCINSIIKKQIEQIKSSNEAGIYNVLIILIHGSIQNIDESMSLLQSAVLLPLTIFIIGVGKGNFSAVEKFVSEAKKQKQQMVRKIVNYCKCDFSVLEATKVKLFKRLHNQMTQYAEMPQQKPIGKIQGYN